MKNTALGVVDLQNDVTKNSKKIIGQVNEAFTYCADKGCDVKKTGRWNSVGQSLKTSNNI